MIPQGCPAREFSKGKQPVIVVTTTQKDQVIIYAVGVDQGQPRFLGEKCCGDPGLLSLSPFCFPDAGLCVIPRLGRDGGAAS